MRIVHGLMATAMILILAALVAGYFVLQRYDFNDLKPRMARAVWEATGRELSIEGDIKLNISRNPRLSMTGISIQNAAWGSRPAMLTLEKAEVEVELWPLIRSRHLVVNRLILARPDLLVEIGPDGKSNLDFANGGEAKAAAPAASGGAPAPSPPPPPPPPAPPAAGRAAAPSLAGVVAGLHDLGIFAFRNVWLERGRLTVVDHRPGGDTRVLDLRRLRTAQPDPEGPIIFLLSGQVGEETFDCKGEMGTLDNLEERKEPWPLKLSARALGAELELKGEIKRPAELKELALKVDLEGEDLARLGLPVGGAFQLSASLDDPGQRTYRLKDMKLGLPGNELAGWLALSLAGPRPRLEGELATARLDLAPFLPAPAPPAKAPEPDPAVAPAEKSPDPAAPAPPAPERLLPDPPLPSLAGLGRLDLAGRIKAGELRHPRFVLRELDATLALEGGKLTASPLRGRLAGGTLDADLTLQAQGEAARAELDLAVENCDLASLIREAGREPALEGGLTARLRLRGAGASLGRFLAGADGQAAAVLRQGRLKRGSLEFLGDDLLGGLSSLAGDLFKERDQTEFSCLVAGGVIKRGALESTALALRTPRMSLLGRGRLNLGSEAFELALTPRPHQNTVAGLNLSLGRLLKPVKLTGTLARPHLALDQMETLAMLGRTVGSYLALGPAGLATGLLGAGGEIDALCEEASEAAFAGRPYQPRYRPLPPSPSPPEPLKELGEAVKSLLAN